MKKRIFRGASLILLTLSIPAISWSLKEKEEISNVSTKKEVQTSVVTSENSSAQTLFENHITEIYDSAQLASASLDFEVFKKALIGFYNLKGNFKLSAEKDIITIVDFTKPSTQKRMWIVDLASRKLLFNNLVAHGMGSGDNMATNFSNQADSHQSSLGFYVTENTYFGKHGMSLHLQGVDKGYNTNAYSRAVVVHGADYVSQDFVNSHGRLGRSHGCPAVPVELAGDIINTIKGGTALFLYSGNVESYKSDFLNAEVAVNNFVSANQSLAKL